MSPGTPRVTPAQLETLERIERLMDGGDDGMYPRGPGGWAHMMALKRRGLVRCAGVGQASDDGPEEVVIYELTDAGRAVLGASR